MQIGYDPTRVRDLTRRTAASIDSLGALRSSDQAAADALRVVRLTRQNLEDQWMPLLREIEGSGAMVSWLSTALDATRTIQAIGAQVAQWLIHHEEPGTRDDLDWSEYTERSDEELLDWLAYASRIPFPWQERFGHTTSALVGFSEDLASRVEADTDFAARLVALAPTTPLIAISTGEANFPPTFTRDVTIAMLGSVPWFSGLGAQLEAEAVQVAMSTLLHDPDACLDVLTDADALLALARWPLLDTEMVQKFTTAGLYEAVLLDVGRLSDGYDILAELTRLTNGPLDDGIQPGLARGVAIAMDGYIDTLAPAVRHEGSNPVLVIARDHGIEIELGTYDEVVNLFGTLMRDAPAQAALGLALGGYTSEVVNNLGVNITEHLGLDRVTRFADLLGDAARAEQAELIMAAAAEEAFRRQLGRAARFGVDTALTVTGVGIVARGLTSRALDIAVTWAANVDPDDIVDLSIPSQTYDLITIAALAMVVENPSMRSSLGLGGVSRQSWSAVQEQLDKIEESTDSQKRVRNVEILNRYIEDEVPDLGGYVRDVRNVEGLAELTEQRNATRAD